MMSRLSSQAVSSPLTESVSPLTWGTSSSASSNNMLSRNSTRSSPIAILRNPEEIRDSDSEDEGDVVHSFQQLVLNENQDDGQFCVGSLPTSHRRRRQQHSQLGTSLPAAPLLRSTRMRTPNIPPIALPEGGQEPSPSYGSLRESQLAGRFLDGPCSYRDKESGQIKSWHHKVRFQSTEKSTPGERIRELRGQQQQDTPNSNSSSLAAIMSSSQDAPQSSFVDHEYSLQQDNILSTSLTGLELLQRGLSVDDRPPDASHLSSWSSSEANTYDAVTEQQASPPDDANLSLDQTTENNNMTALPDDDEDDDGPVFDLDME